MTNLEINSYIQIRDAFSNILFSSENYNKQVGSIHMFKLIGVEKSETNKVKLITCDPDSGSSRKNP